MRPLLTASKAILGRRFIPTLILKNLPDLPLPLRRGEAGDELAVAESGGKQTDSDGRTPTSMERKSGGHDRGLHLPGARPAITLHPQRGSLGDVVGN